MTEESLIKGKAYTLIYADGRKEFLGLYHGIVSREILEGYPGYSMHGTGKHKDMHSFPERQAIWEKRFGYRSDASMTFDIGHFTKYGSTFEEGDTVDKK